MKFDIVMYLIGIGSWKTFHRRPMIEALAHNLQGTGRILCINPPVSPLVDVLFYRERFFQWLHTPRFCQVSCNLFVYSPVVWLHRRLAERIGARKTHQHVLSRQIQGVLTKLGFSGEHRVCWLYRPEQVACLGWGEEAYTVYECYDEYREQFEGSTRAQMVENESLLLHDADIVFTTSRSLYQSRSKVHSNVHYAPNGVDYDLFSADQHSSTPVPEDLARIPEPRIGFVGNVIGYVRAGLLDLDLLLQVATACRDWSIVLIGSLNKRPDLGDGSANMNKFAALSRMKNVYLVGERPYRQVPTYLRGLNVTIMPFLLNDYIHKSNPLKLWEYLAAGKVVVSTALDQVSQYQDIIYVSRTSEDFISGLEAALTVDNSERVAKGILLAKEHSWSVLTQRMLDVVSAGIR